MPTITDLSALVDEFAAAVPELNLDGGELEGWKNITPCCSLQNQVEIGEPIEWIVNECINYLNDVVAVE